MKDNRRNATDGFDHEVSQMTEEFIKKLQALSMQRAIKTASAKFGAQWESTVPLDIAQDDTETQILGYLRGKEPQTISQIGKALGLSTAELRPAIDALLKSGKIAKTGNSRGTKYAINGDSEADTPPQGAA